MWRDIKMQWKIILRDYKNCRPETEEMETRKRVSIAIILLMISAGLVTAGVTRGEVFIVFTKAVHICLECIGLG